MRTVFVVTVFRRYHELRRNLERNLTLARQELGQAPEVILVWARPEFARQWFIDELVREGLVHHVLKRPELEGETTTGGTSYPESRNLRLGLEFAQGIARCGHCGSESAMLVGLAADIELLPDTLRIMRKAVLDGERAVVYHWANNCIHENVWHTNCFAVHSSHPDWWPPLSEAAQQDVLERQWGRQLERMERVCRGHNSGERRFLHRHSSEELPPLECRPVRVESGVGLSLSGARKGWLVGMRERVMNWVRNWYVWMGEPVFSQRPAEAEEKVEGDCIRHTSAANRPTLVGRAVLVRDGKILLGLRADAGRWECPGGKVEDELTEDGVRRELLEETGLMANGPMELVGYHDGTHLTNKKRFTDIFLAIPEWSGQPQLLEGKHLEWQWMELGTAMALPLMPSTRRLLEESWPRFVERRRG